MKRLRILRRWFARRFGRWRLASGATAIPIIVNVNPIDTASQSFTTPSGPTNRLQHIDLPPGIFASGGAFVESAGVTHSSARAISSGAQTVELSLLGHYSADNFSIVPDQANGTLITYVPHNTYVPHDLIV
jgi:hypothetical protein